MSQIAPKEHKDSASLARDLLATYKDSEDLINIGAYVKGSNKKIDMAVAYNDKLNSFLCQGIDEKTSFDETQQTLISMFK